MVIALLVTDLFLMTPVAVEVLVISEPAVLVT